MISRLEKVQGLLREEIAHLITRQVDLSKEVLVTVKEVDLSPDLRYAKVRTSILPFIKAKETLKSLNNQTGAIWKSLSQKISLKVIPQIKFVLDSGEEKIARVEELLKK